MSARPATPQDGGRWFEIARLRLSNFRTTNPGYLALGTGEPPPPSSLSELIAEAAAIWADKAAGLAAGAVAPEPIDGAEAFRALAARHDLEAQRDERRADTLADTEFPVVLVTGRDLGRLLVARHGQVFLARARGVTYEVAAAALAAEETGTLFRLTSRQIDSLAGRSDAVHDLAGPHEASQASSNPVQDVIGAMLGRQRGLLAQLIIAAIISNLTLLALPVYTGLVFDRVIPHAAFDTLWAVSIGVLFALSADLCVRWVRLKLQDALAGAASASLQASLVRRLVHLRMSDAPRAAGALTLRLREIDGLTQLVPQAITGICVDAPFLLVVFALIWMNGGPVVLAPILGILLLIAVHVLGHARAAADQERSTKLLRLQTNQIIETVEGLEGVKTSCTQRRVIGRFERTFDELAHSAHVVRLWQGISAYANITIGQMMVVAVAVVGVYQIAEGAMTIGGLTACTLLVGRVISPIGQLISTLHRVRQSAHMLRGLADVSPGAQEEAGDRSGALPAPSRGDIRLVDLSFAYPGHTSLQVDGVSLRIAPGERVAIVGRSGSGKSTLLKLFTRLLEPTRGSISVDGYDARQYDPSDLRRTIGYMGQSQNLVDDTLLANLTLGLPPVDPARFDLIMRLSGVADVVARHPQGYGMPLGLRGERLSGGERQAVALARLLLAEPAVLLLDEPTAAMDTMAEARLVQELRTHLDGRTLVVATHRAAMLDLADRMIWLEGGRIAADGPKAEVMARLAGGKAAKA